MALGSRHLQSRLRYGLGSDRAADELLASMGLPPTTGTYWWVDSSTGSNTTKDGRDPDNAFATVDAAINACTASKGDTIIVMPGHAETASAADAFDADVAGIRIIGLGWGGLRPTFSFSATAGKCSVGAANVQIYNLRFVAGISAVVVPLNVEAGADDFHLEGCEFYWGGTTGYDFIDSVILNGVARPTIINNRFLCEPAVAGAARCVHLLGACSNTRIYRNEFMGDASVAYINGTSALSQGVMVLDNLVHNTDASEPYLEVLTGTTGVIAGTRGLASGGTVAANAVADAMAHCENFVVNTAGTIAIVKGAGGSPALDAD